MAVLSIILGVLLVIAGVWCLFTPFITFAVFFEMLGWLIGLALIVIGVLKIIDYFTNHRSGTVNGWDLTAGILTTILGLFIFFNIFIQFAIDSIIFFCLIDWFIIVGILQIISSIKLKKAEVSSWSLTLIAGILSILLGIFAIINPFSFAIAEGWIIAFFIIMAGFNLISSGSTMNKSK